MRNRNRIFIIFLFCIFCASIIAEARELKQSTTANIMVFMSDPADHISGKTGLTLAISASKDGGAFSSITPTVTERGNGWYSLALTASHTDTTGDLALHITASGADPADTRYIVVANIESDTYARIGAPAGSSVSADIAAVKGDTGNIITESQSHPTLSEIEASAILAKEATVNTRASQSSVDTLSGYVDTEVAAIKAKTDNLPAQPASVSDIPSAGAVADAVWDEALSGHAASGSAGKALKDAGAQGSGDTAVDHNTGGTDNLRYVYQSQGIDNATVKIYLKTDYDAGNNGESYVKARARTKTDGRWQYPVYLDSGFTYAVVFYKQGQYGPTKVEVSIP